MNETLSILVAALRKAASDQFASGYLDKMMLGDVLKSIADAIEAELAKATHPSHCRCKDCKPKP